MGGAFRYWWAITYSLAVAQPIRMQIIDHWLDFTKNNYLALACGVQINIPSSPPARAVGDRQSPGNRKAAEWKVLGINLQIWKRKSQMVTITFLLVNQLILSLEPAIKEAGSLTHSTSQAKQDLLLTTLHAILKTLFTWFVANAVTKLTMYKKKMTKRSLQRTPQTSRQAQQWEGHRILQETAKPYK